MGILFLTPTDATYISNLNPNQVFGPAENLPVGQTSIPGNIYRSLIKFDTSLIPTGSLITNATLRLFLNDKTSPGINTLMINNNLSDFSQNTTTWNNAPPFESTAHSTPLNGGNVNNYIYVSVTDLVQEWYSGLVPNNGITLTTEETLNSLMNFWGYEDGNVPLWPTLIIEYTSLIGPTGPTGATGATGAFILGKQTAF